MAKKTALDKLHEAIGDILEEYADAIGENVDQIVQDMGKKGVQALRAKSKEALKQHTGGYAGGWKCDYSQTRLNTKATLYNTSPGLPHLLENGHVTRNGTGRTYGWTPAHQHIAPVAEELVDTFEREVMSKL